MTIRNPQPFASIVRQVLAIAGVVFGVLTQSVTALHLPVAVSSILLVAGSVILAVEHYVSDPSTGTTTVPSSAPTSVAAVPVVPPPPPAPVAPAVAS